MNIPIYINDKQVVTTDMTLAQFESVSIDEAEAFLHLRKLGDRKQWTRIERTHEPVKDLRFYKKEAK